MSERLYVDNWDWEDGAARAHLFRYYLARGFVNRGEQVNDVACGSQLLAEVAGHVSGFDYDPSAIGHAKDYHLKDNIDFEVADFNEISSLPGCDISISIETIEHLKDPEKFARLLKDSTKRAIFLTTPIIPTVYANPHHLHDFTPGQIEAMFMDEIWRSFHSYKQGAGSNNAYGGFIFYRK